MAQEIKTMAARMADNSSYSFKEFINRIKENRNGYTKWDLVKGTLWYGWYKFADWCKVGVEFLIECVFPILGAIIKGIALILGFILVQACVLIAFVGIGIPASLIGLITMPIWYPIMVWVAPEHAANVIYDWQEPADDDKLPIIGEILWYAWNCLVFCVIGKALFGWIACLYPMRQFKYFMNKMQKGLEDYDAATQIAYVMAFASDDERKNAISNMSYQSVEKFWKDYPDMHRLILARWMLCEKWAREMLAAEDEESWKLLLNTAYNADNKIGDDVLQYFISEMGKNEKARKVFTAYGAKHTLSAVVLKELIALAGKGNENAKKALEIYAWREALSAELLEVVYGTGNEELIKAMQSIAKMHADIDIIRDTQRNDPEKNQWRQFCELVDYIAPEAQKCLNRSQYSIFKSTGHILDREALRYLLLAQSGDGHSYYYFKELLEGEFEQVDEKLKAQICAEVWRQKVYLQVAADKAEKAEAAAAAELLRAE